MTVLAQQPVIPAQSPLSDNAQACQQIGIAFDRQEHLWKRWQAHVVSSQPGERRLVVGMETSGDQCHWTATAGSCFEQLLPGRAACSETDMPVVVYSEHEPAGRRFLMWYGATGNQLLPDGLPQSDLGLATSVDGRSFTSLPPSESPAAAQGVVLKATQAFERGANVSSATLGSPQVFLQADGSYQLTFYKIGFAADGRMVDAGIGHAISKDGATWDFLPDEPVAVTVVGKSENPDRLIAQLRHLAAAYGSEQTY